MTLRPVSFLQRERAVGSPLANETDGGVRSQLDQQGWERIVTAQEKSGEYIGFYVKTSGDESLAGLVVTMRNRNQKEAVFVNLAGDIKLDQFATVGKALDLDPLRKVARAIKQ